MLIRSLLLLLILCLTGTSYSQSKATKKSIETDLSHARFQIKDIHSRGIIVRLRTDKERIKTMRTQGYHKAADELEQRLRSTNLQLCYAFITKWTFGPVYFMESQHTAQLQRDSLVALTWDLRRDTVIAIPHDSLYIVDYGTLLENTPGEDRTADQSNTPLAGSYLVTLGSNMQQLTAPLPFSAKVWGDRMVATDLLVPATMPAELTDSIVQGLSKYPIVDSLIHKEYKNAMARYMLAMYDHINYGSAGGGNKDIKAYINPFTDAAERFCEHYIQYYCKRMDKDQGVIYSQSPIYWWLRNPNIRYLLYLRDLEQRLKDSLDTREKFTAPR